MFKVYAEYTINPMYMNRKELELFCENVIVENFPTRKERENIKYFLPQYTIAQNAKYSAVRILRGLGFKIENMQ